MTLCKNSVCVKGTLGYFRNHCLPRCRFSHHECLLWWGERDASGWRHGRRGCVVIRRASSNWQILLEAKNICSIKKWYSRYILAHIILLNRRKKVLVLDVPEVRSLVRPVERWQRRCQWTWRLQYRKWLQLDLECRIWKCSLSWFVI